MTNPLRVWLMQVEEQEPFGFILTLHAVAADIPQAADPNALAVKKAIAESQGKLTDLIVSEDLTQGQAEHLLEDGIRDRKLIKDIVIRGTNHDDVKELYKFLVAGGMRVGERTFQVFASGLEATKGTKALLSLSLIGS